MSKVHKVRRLQIGEKVVDQTGGASPAFSVLWQQLVANSDTLDAGKIDKSQDLTSLSKAKWTGIAVRVGSDSWTGRTLQAGTGISITNPGGIAGDPTITCTVSAYTDEQAQDAVGTILTDTATIDFTYNDAGNQITADVKAGSIGATQLANTAVTAGSYTSADITVDAQGRITAAANGAGGGGGGSGTVTSVSVVTANGVSGSVATSTTTPAITLTLGAITPSSVAATGTVTGSNLSGTNTGNQTITLTGDVTGSGTGSFAATLATSGVAAATYGDSTHVPQIAVDAKGRITSASNVAISGAASAPTLVQAAYARTTNNTAANVSVTLGATPTVDNLLVAITIGHSSGSVYPNISGWLQVLNSQNSPVSSQGFLVQTRVVRAGDGTGWTQTLSSSNGGQVFAVMEFSGWSGVTARSASASGLNSSTSIFLPAAHMVPNSYGIIALEKDNLDAYSSISGGTLLFDGTGGGTNHPSVLAKISSATTMQITFTGSTFTTPLLGLVDVF